MKKILTFLLLGIFLISFTSAFLDVKHFDKDYGAYGKIEIDDYLFFSKAEYSLTDLDSSIINSWAEGEYILKKRTHLFTGAFYKDMFGNRGNLKNIKFYIWENKLETRYNPIYEDEDCTIKISLNQTETEVCRSVLVSNESYQVDLSRWISYEEGEELEESTGRWRMTAERKANTPGDFILEAHGKEFEEWAWWDNSWEKVREVSNLTGNISYFNISYSDISSAQSDFDDVRFTSINNATELNFTISNKTDGQWATFRVNNLANTSIMMWYDNPSVSTTSSASDTYYNPVSYYYTDAETGTPVLDSVGVNDGVWAGTPAWVDGEIGNAVDFDGGDVNFVNTNNVFYSGTDNFTVGLLVKSDTSQNAFAVALYTEGAGVTGFNFMSDFTTASKMNLMWGDGGSNYGMSFGYDPDSDFGYHYLVARKDGANISIWLDGSFVASDSVHAISFSAQEVILGKSVLNAGRGWEGPIDEVLLSDRAMTDEEIVSISTQNERVAVLGSEIENNQITITSISPVDNFNSTSGSVEFNCSGTDENGLFSLNLTINGTVVETVTGAGTTNLSLVSTEVLSDDLYQWYCTGNDNITTANSTMRFLTVDSTPPMISVQNPNGTLGSGLVGSNETLNVTFTDNNLGLCWYNYNGTNVSIEGCLTGVKNSTKFILETGNTNMTIYANDSLGSLNSTFVEWEYAILEINQTFINQTTEGSTQNISALITLAAGETISAAILNYNGSLSAGTSEISGDNIIISESGFVTPNVETDEVVDFQWSIVLSGGVVINLTQQNQTIFKIEADNCSTFTNKILDMEMVDEKTQIALSNTTLEIAINIFSSDRSTRIINFSSEFEDINPVGICLNINITEGISYFMDSIIRYVAQGYANEYYNIVGNTLDSTSETQNLTLYDLNITKSTDFQLTFTGEDFLPVENALVSVERQYISENTFKTVELPKTDSNGQTILHLVRNDVIYNILVIKEGEILGNFANVVAFCEDFTIGSCSLPLNAISNTSLVFNYDDEIGLIFQENTQYNETTSVASFSFASTDGTTKVVNMRIERRDVFGNRSVCENTLVSSTGTVSCQVNPGITDTTLVSIISVDGEDKINSEIIIDDTAYGQNGYAMFFIFAIAVLLMFSGSKTWTLVGVSINYILGVSMGLIIGGIAGVGSTGIFVLIISVVGIWQLNKERKQ